MTADDPAMAFERSRGATFTWRTIGPHLVQFLRNLPRVRRAKKAGRVSDAFAEKIMLAVTAVNECPYCARYHTDLAADADVSRETVRQILENDVETAVDDDELPALQFAQHYAESNADPDEAALEELYAVYGRQTGEDVLAYVRAIYFGNLLGNTYDAVRASLSSFGRSLRTRLERTRSSLERRCPLC
ncbi:carboxymuconolactone decarboxylase family protein [Natribaculum luteum]|uniref:Carboxymuconolactone decarboxylase family protein n=1 Tax=Natribaculum luteum TaxID=1586232 RepID=A0ABD5P475_9EURY|nr:carboxymuconolactone decarboxylase family protein [Natribaculum luteum]